MKKVLESIWLPGLPLFPFNHYWSSLVRISPGIGRFLELLSYFCGRIWEEYCPQEGTVLKLGLASSLRALVGFTKRFVQWGWCVSPSLETGPPSASF